MQTSMFQLSGIDQCIQVHGEEGMRAYSMGPNCRVPLFDDDDDVFWIKTTDQNGFPSARRFRFHEEVMLDSKENSIALSDIRSIIREELGFIKEEMINAQQYIPETVPTTTDTTISTEYDRSTANANAKHHGNNSRNRQQRANTPNVAIGEKQQQPTSGNAAIGE